VLNDRDITSGNNSSCDTKGLSAAPGWDPVGTVTEASLLCPSRKSELKSDYNNSLGTVLSGGIADRDRIEHPTDLI
jgi:hypothetical protein